MVKVDLNVIFLFCLNFSEFHPIYAYEYYVHKKEEH